METVEAIFIAVLFAVGGAFYNYFSKRYFQRYRKPKSDYEMTIQLMISSIFILFINIAVLKIFFKINISSLNELISNLGSISFFMKYFILTITTSFISVFLFEKGFMPLQLYGINKIKSGENIPVETKYTTVWEDVFENKDDPIDWAVVTIEKDGNLITQGILSNWSAPNAEKNELLLENKTLVADVIKKDINSPPDEKILYIVKKEYFDFQTGTLITFYENEKFKTYVETLL